MKTITTIQVESIHGNFIINQDKEYCAKHLHALLSSQYKGNILKIADIRMVRTMLDCTLRDARIFCLDAYKAGGIS